MKYKLQCKWKIYKSTLKNSKWAVSKPNDERETVKYNNGVKQNLKYTETETIYTNQQWDNLNTQ
jgi:hypothetical protein